MAPSKPTAIAKPIVEFRAEAEDAQARRRVEHADFSPSTASMAPPRGAPVHVAREARGLEYAIVNHIGHGSRVGTSERAGSGWRKPDGGRA